ncbi:MAG: electron transport complex subunit RsxC, partial [Pseudomonadota bacterium]
MSAPTERLSRLPGGLRLPPNKSMSTASAITDVAVPPRLKLPLRQHAGSTAEPIVTAGQRVLKGELLATGGGPVSAGVHASTSGVVTSIEPLPMPARGEPIVATIVLEADGEDTPAPELEAVSDPLSLDTAEFLERIEAGGIVGLGGAAYPTAQKITHAFGGGVRALLLNGVECESYISCDDRLMREHAAEVLRGAVLLLHGLAAPRAIVAVESDKPQAMAALKEAAAALADERIELVEVPTVYPSGGEDQLVLLLSGREVPSGGLPSDVGYLVQNVGTAYAVARLIDAGEPLISRVVTVTGEGIERPGTYRIRFGTPIADVVAAAGGYNDRAKRLLMGGPMTGIALTDDALPVVKAMNCLLVTGAAVHLSAEPERPCIRCGECALHCPVQLLPQRLHREATRN